VPTQPYHSRLGDLAIEELYVYPRETGRMTRDEVLRAVADFMSRRGAIQPVTGTFRDGSTMRAAPIGMQVPQPGTVEITFFEASTNARRAVDADEVASVQ
jgi:hypothetical protein